MNDYITKTDAFMARVAVADGVRVARVGGSVRDEILGRRVKDADYVVFGATLHRLHEILRFMGTAKQHISSLKLRDGRQAGWRVAQPGLGLIEIMLPRAEVSTGPGHRDFEIILDPNLTPEKDAIRRDFTFNALYKWINPETRTSVSHDGGRMVLENITDPTGRGLYDLQHKLVNTTHPSSFRDDPLRTLRALRFVSTLGYDLSTLCEAQMKEHASAVCGLNFQENTSGTVLTEMSKLLMGDDAGKALRHMRDTGVMAVLFPVLADMINHEPSSKYHDLTTDEHTFRAIDAAVKANAPLEVRWALLFHDCGKPAVEWTDALGYKHFYARKEDVSEDCIDPYDGHITMDHEEYGEILWREAAGRMNADKALRESVATLIRNHMVTVQPRNTRVKVARMRVRFGDEMTHNLLLHRVCDLMGKNKTSPAQIQHVADQERIREALQDAGVPSSVKDLEISGHHVIAMGAVGRQIGEVLTAVLDEVVCQPDALRRSFEFQLSAAARHVERLSK